jgi:hypothetical protein
LNIELGHVLGHRKIPKRYLVEVAVDIWQLLVELRGFEPVISAMRHPRALDGVPLPTAMAFLRSCANTGAGTIDRTP